MASTATLDTHTDDAPGTHIIAHLTAQLSQAELNIMRVRESNCAMKRLLEQMKAEIAWLRVRAMELGLDGADAGGPEEWGLDWTEDVVL